MYYIQFPDSCYVRMSHDNYNFSVLASNNFFFHLFSSFNDIYAMVARKACDSRYTLMSMDCEWFGINCVLCFLIDFHWRWKKRKRKTLKMTINSWN